MIKLVHYWNYVRELCYILLWVTFWIIKKKEWWVKRISLVNETFFLVKGIKLKANVECSINKWIGKNITMGWDEEDARFRIALCQWPTLVFLNRNRHSSYTLLSLFHDGCVFEVTVKLRPAFKAFLMTCLIDISCFRFWIRVFEGLTTQFTIMH